MTLHKLNQRQLALPLVEPIHNRSIARQFAEATRIFNNPRRHPWETISTATRLLHVVDDSSTSIDLGDQPERVPRQ